jgi:hypothetical protein
MLHSPWSAVIGLVLVVAWVLMFWAIFFPGKPQKKDREDGWF